VLVLVALPMASVPGLVIRLRSRHCIAVASDRRIPVKPKKLTRIRSFGFTAASSSASNSSGRNHSRRRRFTGTDSTLVIGLRASAPVPSRSQSKRSAQA
jgi:hypothetical protein